MMKTIMWVAKEEMACDAFCVLMVQDHQLEILQNELKFKPDATPLNFYMLNYSLGENTV